MSDMRLLKYWTNEGEDEAYTIVELSVGGRNVHPLVHFEHEGFSVPTYALHNVESLKKKLRDMLKACDQPAMTLTPEKVIPASVQEVANG